MNLGVLLMEKGDLDGAEGMYRRSLNIQEKALGMEHSNVSFSCYNFGLLLKAKGDFDGSKDMFRRSLMIREKTFGMQHPRTIAARDQLQLITNQASGAQSGEGASAASGPNQANAGGAASSASGAQSGGGASAASGPNQANAGGAKCCCVAQ